MYDPYAAFKRFTLQNGLTVYHQYWERPWIAAKVVIHAGGREDPLALPGLAHFVEHCVSENIQGYRRIDAEDFMKDMGGRSMFGSTSYLATQYGFSLPAKVKWTKEAFSIFGNMLLNAKITRRIEKERSIIQQEFHQRYPNLIMLEWDQARFQSLFPGHRLETWNRPIGRPEGFLRVNRTDLQAFYDRFYVPANMSLVILGGMDWTRCYKMLQESPFGAMKPGVRNPVAKAMKEPLPIGENRTIDVSASSFTSLRPSQTGYEANWSLPGDLPDAALVIASEMLDRILAERVREQLGASYNFSSHFSQYQDVSLFFIDGRFDPKLTPRIDKLVRSCIKSCVRNEVTFERLKSRICQRLLMTDLSGQGLVNRTSDDLEELQRIETLSETLRLRRRVTFNDVKRVFELLSEDRQYTFILRP